jgi:hypothetical protein
MGASVGFHFGTSIHLFYEVTPPFFFGLLESRLWKGIELVDAHVTRVPQ